MSKLLEGADNHFEEVYFLFLVKVSADATKRFGNNRVVYEIYNQEVPKVKLRN